jgi:hypothetical protein
VEGELRNGGAELMTNFEKTRPPESAVMNGAGWHHCRSMPHRFAVILLSQHPVDMHLFSSSQQTGLHFGPGLFLSQ